MLADYYFLKQRYQKSRKILILRGLKKIVNTNYALIIYQLFIMHKEKTNKHCNHH
jgi:hypothetical protein